MRLRSPPLLTFGIAALLGGMALVLLRAASGDHVQELTAAMLRHAAGSALQQLEQRLRQEVEIAALLLPAAGAEEEQEEGPAALTPLAAGLLRQRGWLGLQRGDAALAGPLAADGPAWPADAEGLARARGFQQMVLSPLRPAAPGLPAHLLLQAPLPVQQGGDVLTLVLPADFLAQRLREQAHPAGLRLRLIDRAGAEIGRRTVPGDAVADVAATAAPAAAGAPAEWLSSDIQGLQLAADLAGPVPDWLPQPSRLTLAMGLALGLALILVCILGYKTRRGQAAQRALDAALAEAEAERRLSDIAANLPGAIYRLVRSPDGVVACTYMSEGVNLLLAEPAGSSPRHSLMRGLTPETRQKLEAALRHSAETLQPMQVEGNVLAADGRRLWLRSQASVHPLPDGGMLWDGVLLDSTEQRQAEERATLLAREVDHRAKNIMAVVRSLLLLTPRDVPPAQFVANLDGRLCALARAHDLLAGQGWAGADLAQVVQRELATYDQIAGHAQIAWSGPAARLASGSVQPVEMILHELSTNAAKHGALSRPGGLVELRWTAAPQGGLLIDWRESGGPPVRGEPGRHGFGFRLIHTLARHQLSGGATFLWSEEGLQCRIRLGAASVAAVEAPPVPAAADSPLDIPAPPVARQA
ncbi:HWE histidine kinase domain-containing protein [Roseomonas sp. USHLN139]|uniref:HWE histidine kinase domain-containing protein n=1 Tax=Roseomonas sp. USHLN139 TaxID=3081298 RepID=UPI003B02154B